MRKTKNYEYLKNSDERETFVKNFGKERGRNENI